MVTGENREKVDRLTDERMIDAAQSLMLFTRCASWFTSEARTRSVFRCLVGVHPASETNHMNCLNSDSPGVEHMPLLIRGLPAEEMFEEDGSLKFTATNVTSHEEMFAQGLYPSSTKDEDLYDLIRTMGLESLAEKSGKEVVEPRYHSLHC